MKTVWNVLSDNEIMDHPCVQTFAKETDAVKMVQELFRCYCDEHDLDALLARLKVDDIPSGKYYRFIGGDWEEWVYLFETPLNLGTDYMFGRPASVIEKDF